MKPKFEKNMRALRGLAFGLAVLFTAGLPAKPPAQNYPEYPHRDGSAQTTVTAQPAYDQQVQSTSSTQTAASWQATTTTTAAASPTASRSAAGPAIGPRFDSNLYTVEKIPVRTSSQVGEENTYLLRVTALADITDVNISETLPDGLNLVSTSPTATRDGRVLRWAAIPRMSAGQIEEKTIVVKTTREGDFLTTSKVCIDPVVQLALRAGTPRLALAKTGPATIELGDRFSYSITVTNNGTADAADVVVVDNLPQGLTSSGPTTFTIGTLAVGESRTLNVPVTAANAGEYVNTASVTASNAASVSTRAASPTRIVTSRIQVEKTGPDRIFVHRDATYNITVTNVGDVALENITVTDSLPKNVTLVSASGSKGSQSKDRVVWTIPSLAPGQSLTDSVVITSSQPQTTTNSVTARAANAKVSDTASATTIWEGAPGVLTEIFDNVDPIRIGDEVVYTIRITNQGAFREVNSQVRVIFSDEINPVSITDQTATINGKEVVFPDVVIKPKGATLFKIHAKAVRSGVATTRLEFNSSFLPRPIVKEETTFVY
ncbi:MAG: DUF11 domain-containing protein [Opitutaceae bacterium]|jgi:uncharacterized repeat protein (TIGR01451 family)|nr:DUF11 domain-containing protein [Opitutaceae bacterium]